MRLIDHLMVLALMVNAEPLNLLDVTSEWKVKECARWVVLSSIALYLHIVVMWVLVMVALKPVMTK